MTVRTTEHSHTPLRLLSLDGGGVRGLSSIMMLDKLMESIAREEKIAGVRPSNNTDQLKPCEYFDLIGGTSTGGIIAILLSRFGLDCKQVIDIYMRLSKEVFYHDRSIQMLGAKIPRRSSRFSAKVLENTIKRALVDLGHDADELMWDEFFDEDLTSSQSPSSKNRCRGFVLTVSIQDPERAEVLATYNHGDRKTRVWEALRATSAAPGFFKEMRLGRSGGTYIDGGMGFNNPCEKLIAEAKDIWGDRPIGVVLSLGTGLKACSSVKSVASWLPCGLSTLWRLAPAILRYPTGTYRVHEEMKCRFDKTSTCYYRLNVDHDLADIGLEQWGKMHEIKELTERYMSDPIQLQLTEDFGKSMARHGSSVIIQVNNAICLHIGIGGPTDRPLTPTPMNLEQRSSSVPYRKENLTLIDDERSRVFHTGKRSLCNGRRRATSLPIVTGEALHLMWV